MGAIVIAVQRWIFYASFLLRFAARYFVPWEHTITRRGTKCAPSVEHRWWSALDWDEYDNGEEGGWRTAYPNLVWEYLGLRNEARDDVPDWAGSFKGFEDLGQAVGMLFVTDDRDQAESRYGPVTAIDMTSPDILEVVPDPNPGLYNAWILLIRVGAPIPVMTMPSLVAGSVGP